MGLDRGFLNPSWVSPAVYAGFKAGIAALQGYKIETDFQKIEKNSTDIINQINAGLKSPNTSQNLTLPQLAERYGLSKEYGVESIGRFLASNIQGRVYTPQEKAQLQEIAKIQQVGTNENILFKDKVLATVISAGQDFSKAYNLLTGNKILQETLFNPNLVSINVGGFSVTAKEAKEFAQNKLAELSPQDVVGKVAIGILKKGIDFVPQTPIGVAGTAAFFAAAPVVLEAASAVGTAVGITQIASYVNTKNLDSLESGIVNVGLGAGGKGLAYLKEPVILKTDILNPKTIADEKIALLLREGQNVNLGQYEIAKIFPERYAFIASRGSVLLEKINPLTPKFYGENAELSYQELALKYPSGEKVKISEPKIVIGKTDILLTDEGKIIGGLSADYKLKLPEILLQSATPNRAEPIIKAILTGEMGATSSLSKVDLSQLDKPTANVIKELLNLREVSEITLKNTLINDENIYSKLFITQKYPEFKVYEASERPITISKGEVSIEGYTKVRGKARINIKEYPIENVMINEEKLISKVVESKLTKYANIDKTLKGDITSIQKSLGAVQYPREYGLVEEERLVGKTGVKTITEKKLLIKLEAPKPEQIPLRYAEEFNVLGQYFRNVKKVFVSDEFINQEIKGIDLGASKTKAEKEIERTTLHEQEHFYQDVTDYISRLDKRTNDILFKKAESYLGKKYERLGEIPYEKSDYLREYLADKPQIRKKLIGEFGIKASESKVSRAKPEKISVRTEIKTYNFPAPKEAFGETFRTTKPKENFSDEASKQAMQLENQMQNKINQAQQKQVKEAVLETGKKVIAKIGLLVKNVPAPRLKFPEPSQALENAIKSASGLSMLNVPKSSAKEVGREISKEISREIAREVTKTIPRNISKLVPREITKEITRQVTKVIPRTITKEIPREPQAPIVYGTTKVLTEPTIRKSLFLKGATRKRTKQKIKAKGRKVNTAYYEPDLTSLAFNLERTVKRKDLQRFIRNAPELREIVRVIK